MVKLFSSQKNEAHPHSRIFLVGIFAVAFAVRLIFFAALLSDPIPEVSTRSVVYDSYQFVHFAQDLLDSHWLGTKAGTFSPGYPYFVALIFFLFGPNFYAVLAAQFLLGLVLVWMLFKTATLLFNDEKAGLFAAALGALYAPFVFYEGTILRAAVLPLLYLTAFYFSLRAVRHNAVSSFLFAGLALAVAFVFRASPLPPLLFLYILIRRGLPLKVKAGHALIFLLGFLIVLSPILGRNYILKKKVGNWQHGYSIFWIGNAPHASGISHHRSPERTRLTEESEGKIGKTAMIFLREVKRQPKVYLRLYMRKLYMLVNSYEIPANFSFDLHRDRIPILKYGLIGFWFVFPLTLLGLVKMGVTRLRGKALFFLFVLTMNAFVLLFHVQSRYRMPMIPFYLLSAGYGLVYFFTVWKKGRPAKKIILVSFLLLGIMAITPPYQLINACFGSYVPYQYYNNLGIAYYDRFVTREETLSPEEKGDCLTKSLRYTRESSLVLDPRDEALYKELLIDNLLFSGYISLELNNAEDPRRYFEAALTMGGPDRSAEIRSRISHMLTRYENRKPGEPVMPYDIDPP